MSSIAPEVAAKLLLLVLLQNACRALLLFSAPSQLTDLVAQFLFLLFPIVFTKFNFPVLPKAVAIFLFPTQHIFLSRRSID